MNRLRKVGIGIAVALLLAGGAATHLISTASGALSAGSSIAKVDPVRPTLYQGQGTMARVDPVGPARNPGGRIIAKVDPVRPSLDMNTPTVARVDPVRLVLSAS